ncbi:TetR family transcriptional regulator [Halobacillus halophilus]|uniref:TetR family transcription regulator n=1 Tax=Halobacillus halophilus (strain ATCC 35676 / DSM 2266 / JCM 20832 / KCTC 3685 / LMG 17431 / NBRC 102448 / NCIMB 2269) TaxID=866895 RepID=I0JIA8_HALH3|nr:TetR/AcrR family transcriptional regulator [Halobacillus halophilus]ASF41433.1 TetR family transcriptional regulator [Halobacillus halophilus]CCG43876.1 TetR family transcription regulator [Halobacillus halophilus DSM 2266]
MSEKKREIISAAAELIHTKGYEATKLSDIMQASDIGKGQFYHYFSSKRELGLTIVDYYAEMWDRELIQGVFHSSFSAEKKMENMLEWAVNYHVSTQALSGCPFGNLAIEMSEHDEEFRLKINNLIDQWINHLADVMKDLRGEDQALQHARVVVAQIEGGILLMKNYQDISILKDIIAMIRLNYLDKGE